MTAVLAAVFHVVVVAWVVRRLLGVPVGWPRTILLSLIVGVSAGPLWEYVTDLLEVPTRTSGLSQNDAVGVVLIMLLVTAWIVAVDAALLTLLEALVPTGSIPSLFAIVRSAPRWFRRQRRYVSIALIALRHGLGGLFRRGGDLGGPTDVRHEDTAARVRAALTDGGVTFVKLGQMLATRADLLPPAYITEFSQLHSEVPAEAWPTVRGTIEAELQQPIDEVFTRVEESPLAAASVAQVHRATLRTGERVVLKVQRTSSRAEVEADLDIVVRLATLLQHRTRWGRRTDVVGLAVGFANALREELDYRVEVANMRAIAGSSGGDVDVPVVWSDLCTSHLLVMEELDGVPLSRAGDRLDPLSPDEKAALAGVLFDSVLNQIALHGVFHADLHPGNIVVSGTDTEPHLALLDFGSVGRLGRADREALGLLLIAFDLDDSVAATDALTMLLGSPEEFARRDFERQIGALMLRGSTSTDLFTELARLLSTCGFRIPPMIAAAFRAMATLEGSLRLIDAEFDLIEAVRSRTGSSIRNVVESTDVRAEVESQVAAALPLIRRLPQRVDRIVADLEAGRLTVSVGPLSSIVDRTLLRSLVREATAALICAVLAVCGVALIITNGGPALAGVVHANGYVGGVLALVAFLVGARVLVVGIIDRDPAPS